MADQLAFKRQLEESEQELELLVDLDYEEELGDIARALFFTDILIVLLGGILLGWYGALCSALAFLIKVGGIELFTRWVKHRAAQKEEA